MAARTIENEHLKKLKKITLELLKDEKVKIVLFGSRARKDNNIGSDVDIGILPLGEFDERKLTILREWIEQLNIPYKVEIVNFAEVSESFKKAAMKEAVIWKD